MAEAADLAVVRGVIEIVFRVICALFSVGVLIPASVAIPAINQVEDFLNSIGNEYEDADSYRGAAGWLIFVASAAILCHIVMITVRILYITSVIEKHLRIYGVINAILSLLFALSLLSGGIANVVYASDNGDLHTDLCFFRNIDSEFCSNLERVVATEAASGGLSIFSMFLYVASLCIIICASMVETSQSPRINYPAQRVPLPEPAYPSMDPLQYATPSGPYYPPVNVSPSAPVSSHVPPSAPVQPPANAPWYASAEPPPYEIALALHNKYQLEPSSGDPPIANESKTGIVP